MFLTHCSKIPLRHSRLKQVRNRIREITTSCTFKMDYRSCYKTLGLNENCTEEELKTSFFELAKKYHPDSSQEADTAKFYLIENAYRTLQDKFKYELEKSSFNTNIDNPKSNHVDLDPREEDNIEHTAPQHRQYLNYEGIGQGTPYQRGKQYQNYQVKKAIENVYNHRLSQIPNTEENTLVVKNAKASKKIKTKYGIDRLVEDLIQESMSKGEFSNLKGTGKPLPNQNHNPYVDIVTHKINQVLIDNGFSPQWVMLEKEIRSEITKLKGKLQEERMKLGRAPLDPRDSRLWKKLLDTLLDDVKQVNKKINDYNLIVPLLNKQMVHVDLRSLSEKCLRDSPSKLDVPLAENQISPQKGNPKQPEPGLFFLFNSIWKNL